jgi:hypothetical protein
MVSLFVVALSLGADPSPVPCLDSPQAGFESYAGKHKFDGPIEKIRQRAAELALPGSGRPEPPGSFLWQPTYELDFCLRGPTRPYTPQPGDIVLSTDTSKFWKIMHNLAGTGHPTHSMIVFAMPDGKMGILEGGPHDTMKCRIMDALPHMYSYEAEGRVWVRRRAVPLTPEESCRLTEFALAANMRKFALGRLAEQLTPFRTRGPIKTAFVGKPHGLDRESYFCSELVTEACVYAGLLDGRTMRPSATYPRDLFMDHSLNPYLNKHLKLYPCWEPPSRWTSYPSDCPMALVAKPQ